MAPGSVIDGRLGQGLEKLIFALLIGGPLLRIHDALHALPSPIQAALLLAIGAYLVHKLLTFPRWNDEMQHVGKFVRALAALLTVLLIENFCTWATSATDFRKYSYTPLQDNVEIGILWAFEKSPLLRYVVMGWRVDMHWLLYSFVALCLSVVWDAVPYSGFGMGARFINAITWTHALRTIAFLVTVLPNPRPNCYARNFPPVPDSAWEFIMIGFGAKRGSGCNDLVISGHGVVYAAVPLAFGTFYPRGRWGAAALAWVAVAKLCLQEVVDKTHYSVDMLLAVACTVLVWRWQEGVYPASAVWHRRRPGAAADRVPRSIIAVVVAALVIVFVGVKGV